MALETVVIACHLYKKDCDEFKQLCREKAKFHSEVLRDLILTYIEYVNNGWILTDDGWIKPEGAEEAEKDEWTKWGFKKPENPLEEETDEKGKTKSRGILITG